MLDKVSALARKHWKPLAAVGGLLGVYLVAGGSKKKPAAKTASASTGLPKLPFTLAPSQQSATGARVGPTTVTSSPSNAAAEVLADMIRTKGCKDPTTMAAVQAWQAMVGLTADGKYGPLSKARLATFITTPVPPACSWGGA